LVTFISGHVTYSNRTRADIGMAVDDSSVRDLDRVRTECTEPERNFNSTIDGQNISIRNHHSREIDHE